MPEYQVALSFPEERRELVGNLAEILATSLGRDRVFYYPFHRAELAQPNLNLLLQRIYLDRSRLVVAFLDRHYPTKEWCGIERRAILDLIKRGQSAKVMLVKLDDSEDPDFLSIDGYLDGRGLGAADLAGAVLERLAKTEPPEGKSPTATARVTRPGLLRGLLDRYCPRLHRALTRLGVFPEPTELAALESYLSNLSASIKQDILNKTYLPLKARSVSPGGLGEDAARDPFVRFVQLTIRQVLGREEGGDSASAQIAAVNRRSRRVRNIVRTVLRSSDPLVLLGDPGSGKTMTLQEAALAVVLAETRHVFPKVLLYVRLGEFHFEGPVGADEVLTFVQKSAPTAIRPWVEDLARSGRLIIFFDGMDEMSRERYTEHTEALSVFAESRRGRVRTLFSCRITDFSPAFVHRRLVLLPFDRTQILRFLRTYLDRPALEIDGEEIKLSQLARTLDRGHLNVDSRNPFVLWLLCLYLQVRQTWPKSRVELSTFYFSETYRRKLREAAAEGVDLPKSEEAFRSWGRFAWTLMERNRGSAVPASILMEGGEPSEVAAAIQAGRWCGVLDESIQDTEHQVRFEHHRYEEYFAAQWALENRPPIAWLEKLDSPRWQETMLNLVLLGGAEDGIRALATSLAPAVQDLADWFDERQREAEEDPSRPWFATTFAEAKVSSEWEASLADRIELGARIVNGVPTSPQVDAELRPPVRAGLELLSQRGRPLTQVKMIRACQDLPEINVVRVLEHSLRSNVRWVHDQAVVLLGTVRSRPGTEHVDLKTELARHFAIGELISSWLTFARAVAGTAAPRLWLCLGATTLFALLDLGLLGLVAWWLQRILLSACAALPRFTNAILTDAAPAPSNNLRETQRLGELIDLGLHSLPPGTWMAIATGMTALAGLQALRTRSQSPWIWCLTGVPAGISLALIACLLWQGRIASLLLLMPAVFLTLAAFPAIVVVAAGLHGVVLLAYSKLAQALWGLQTRSSELASLSWKNAGFREPLRAVAQESRDAMATLLIVGAAGYETVIASFKVTAAPPAGLAHATLLCLAAGLFLLPRLRIIVSPKKWQWWRRDQLRILGFSVGVTALVGLVVAGIFPFLRRHSDFFSRLLVMLGALLAVALVTDDILWRMRIALAPRRPFGTGSWTPAAWTEMVKRASPREQKELLLRTTYRSVTLDPASFLELLSEVELLIRGEPALSTYWSRRDEIEQALRQERGG